MTRQRALQVSVGTGVGILVVCAAIWILKDGPKGGSVSLDQSPPSEAVAPGITGTPHAPAMSSNNPPVAASPAPPQSAPEVPAAPPSRKTVQDREVPLARLPAEVYQSGPAAPPASLRESTHPGALALIGRLLGQPATAPGPKVNDPLAAARAKLTKDPALTDWFDQWQADHAAERSTPPARVAELQALLAKTPARSADLAAVAAAVAQAESAATPITRAWHAAALDRAERELKAAPQDPEIRRRLDQLKAAAAKAQ